MQSVMRWVLIVAILFASLPASAGKIGFLDTESVIRGVQEGQRQLAILDDWGNRKSDEIEAVRDRAVALGRQLEEQRPVASPEAIAQLEKDLLQAQRNLEDAGRALRRDLEEKQRELLAEVAIRVRIVANDYGNANGFDAIFTLDAQPLVFIADSAIVTDEVIRLYDQRYPVE
jgi:outer membrane protein